MVTKQPKQATKAPSKIIVVDDHPIVRRGLVEMINREPGLEVCGEASSASEAMQLVNKTKPDLLIVDISLDGTSGIELIKMIKASYPELSVLALSMHDEMVYAERALRAGANGYIMKQEATEKLISAIHRALRGEICLSDRMASRLLNQFVGSTGDPGSTSSIDRLSDRELEVFHLIGQGLSTSQIAEKLFLSIKTIETYREHIKQKLSLSTGSELVRYAIQWTLDQA